MTADHTTESKSGNSRIRQRLLKVLDATFGFWLCRIMGYFDYFFHAAAPAKSITVETKPGRILVVRPGGMGDMILLLPVLKCLGEQFPLAQIDIICEKRNISVLHLAGLEKNAVAYDAGIFRVLHKLRNVKYDIAIDTEQFHNFSAIIAFLSRAPIRIGFKINPHRNLLYTHLVNYALDGYEGDQFAGLLEPAGVINFTYRLEGTISSIQATLPPLQNEYLKKLKGKGRLVVVHPGSTSIYKQWDINKFARLVRKIVSERGCTIGLIGSDSDLPYVNAILSETRDLSDRIISFAGTLNLEQTASLIKQSSLFVSGDSGLAHLAIAVGTPTVVIFGPTDPAKWGLNDSKHKVARSPMACSPCFIFGYHKLCRAIGCIAGISAEDVFVKCNELMQPGK